MSKPSFPDSFGVRAKLSSSFGDVDYFHLPGLSEKFGNVDRLPWTIKILLESALRNENGFEFTEQSIRTLAGYNPKAPEITEVPFMPTRVLMQDFTGVPAMVDLVALRSAMDRMGHDPKLINPLIPVDLVIDHSVQVDEYGSDDAFRINAELEFSRNRERYEFLRWGQTAFSNFTVVPPAGGICHQVNLEHLGKVVTKDGRGVACFDSVVGTDSHTPMINGLGILGWGVGGIEAEAVILGQPIFMLVPRVIGFKLTGALNPGITATDLVLTVTKMLREKSVVGQFVEFYGKGLSFLTLPDRATLGNMTPEYGATVSYFPVDDVTLEYMRYTGRDEKVVELAEKYCKAQGMFRTADTPDPDFFDTLELDMSTVRPCIAGPKRPQDQILLSELKSTWGEGLRAPASNRGFAQSESGLKSESEVFYPDGTKGKLTHGDVVISAITSCTNTSNPWVLIGAGILAKKAVEAGLSVHPYVKTSFAPGSTVVTHYMENSGLMPYLKKLGYHILAYGCTTCIGNSGPLGPHIKKAIDDGALVAASVLSGNRNFEGRIHQDIKANYLCSPALVVAFALAGTVNIDFDTEPVGIGTAGREVFLKDIWPADDEIKTHMAAAKDHKVFEQEYGKLLTTNETWNAITFSDDPVYQWNPKSTYIQEPPFFVGLAESADPIRPIDNARVIVKVGDSVTTDHISPAGAFGPGTPAGQYLTQNGVSPGDFNSYGSRRGNDRVMTRGTFANIRLRNLLAPGTEGGFTRYLPTNEVMSIFDGAALYKKGKTPVIVLAGKDYGMGSSRDWAAKGTLLLGIRAVIAQSYERIHRSNLVGMGVLPLQFETGQSAASLGLNGEETFSIRIDDQMKPGQKIKVDYASPDGKAGTFDAISRIDTPVEIQYYRNGGILQTVLRNIISRSKE